MATHSISAFTFRHSAGKSTQSRGKNIHEKDSQISQKSKNHQALSGGGMWRKHQEKMVVWLKIFLVAQLLWSPGRVKKDKNNKISLSMLFFLFLQGKIWGASHQKQIKCRVSPLQYPPNRVFSCPWK